MTESVIISGNCGKRRDGTILRNRFGAAVLAPAIVAMCRFFIRKILKILGFKVKGLG